MNPQVFASTPETQPNDSSYFHRKGLILSYTFAPPSGVLHKGLTKF
jgi:hypothetical protein